jgi:hypothetical protein
VHGAARHARRTGVPRLSMGGRGWRLVLRAAAGGGATAAALVAVGWTPATVGLLAGALTWAVALAGLPGTADSVTRGKSRWLRGGSGR